MGEYVSGVKESGVERRNLGALAIAGAVLGTVSYLCLKATFSVVGRIGEWWWK